MIGARQVEAELLDQLPAEDPRARRSRADLRRVNRLMRHRRLMHDLLLSVSDRQPRRLLELGCGDGTFLLRLAQDLSRIWPGVEVVLVDRQNVVAPATSDAFAVLGWRLEVVIADVFDALTDLPSVDIAMANLFLHHFRDDELARLLRRAAQLCAAFVACEPRRDRIALAGSRLLWAIGCNDVSRHDALASVRAGFRDRELSALWPDQVHWELAEEKRGFFTHAFAAQRKTDGRAA